MLVAGVTFAFDTTSISPTTIKNVSEIDISQGIYDNLYATTDIDEDGSGVFDPEIPTWNSNTFLSAGFNGDLQAGNIEGLLDNLVGIKIKRRVKGDNKWVTLRTISVSQDTLEEDVKFTIFDNLNAAKTNYEYGLTPIVNIDGVIFEGPITIKEIYSDFDGLYILDKDKIYFGFLNLSFPAPTKKNATTVVNTLNSKYPTIIYNSEMNYYTDTCSATWVAADESQEWGWDFEDGWRYRDEFKDWLVNGKAKLLKYYTGRNWLIAVTGDISDSIQTVEENTTTSFNWTEIGDVNDNNDLQKFGLIESAGE